MGTENLRFAFAVAVGAAAALFAWLMIGYLIVQIGSDAPELALPHNLLRIGATVIFGLTGVALVMEKS